jgi:hypothetical protein
VPKAFDAVAFSKAFPAPRYTFRLDQILLLYCNCVDQNRMRLEFLHR